MNKKDRRDKTKISSYIESRFRQCPKCICSILVNLAYHSPNILFDMAKGTLNHIGNKKYLLKTYYKKPVPNGLNNEPREKRIIISLTTIPSRIEFTPYVLGSMLRQTIKPDLIILNLGEELFSDVVLPPIIEKFKSAGIIVRYVPDLKPHTKYYYSMRDYPDDIIITVDDDQIYPLDFIEKLYQSYLENPSAISCYRAHLMLFDEEGELLPYNEWVGEYSELINIPSMRLFATGVGGILYPPHCMHIEVLNKDALFSLSLKADDVWLKLMQVMNNSPVVVVKPFTGLIDVASSKTQRITLCSSNVNLCENDLQIQQVLGRYNNYFGDDDTLLERMQI